MSTIAGYPPHAVASYSRLPNGIIRWTAACGATGSTSSRLGESRTALRRELCQVCFPSGHGTWHPDPKLIEEPS